MKRTGDLNESNVEISHKVKQYGQSVCISIVFDVTVELFFL